MRTTTRILVESTPVIILGILGELLAGVILSMNEDNLTLMPGLLVLLPGIISLRGNINGALGARLGSAIHLGLVEPKMSLSTIKNRLVRDNIYVSLVQNIAMSFLLGVLAYYVSVGLGIENVDMFILTSVSLIAGFFSGLFLMFLTVFLSVFTASRGLDPDNVLTPSVATIGDVATILFLFLTVNLVTVVL